MKWTICVTGKFDAAHYITGHEKCGRIHGHTYKVEVKVISDTVNNGMVMDYNELKKILNEVISKLDHRLLNDVVKEPTAEMLARWIYQQVWEKIPNKIAVRVYEGESGWAEYG